MDISATGMAPPGGNPLEALTAAARRAADTGFATFWSAQIFSMDTLTAFAVIGRDVPGIALGTAVVPVYGRHPAMLAQQALTVNLAIGGRLRLGIGLSHKIVVEGMWGYSWAKPLGYMTEYLEALVPLLHGEPASVSGQQVVSRGAIDVGGTVAPQLLVAALGEKMLALTGRVADGTITWMTGPKTLRDHIVPTINAAAEGAGRPAPQVVASFPFCVTDDVQGARERAARDFAIYGQLPSYRAMLDREGLEGPADLAVIGDEKTCAAAVEEIAASGATELSGVTFGSREEQDRTYAFLGSLV
jgi:5,10-methylenetetrahydromethanopterin reductase